MRKLLGHLPADRSKLSTWQHVAAQLDEAARGADTVDVAVALRLVLFMEALNAAGDCLPCFGST